MYVMISKFADCNGCNASIPDGIPVDLEAKDNPLDGYQLGDENETMLRPAPFRPPARSVHRPPRRSGIFRRH